jgi:hypothetical protein
MLNSPLLERPAISSLLSVIEPVIEEITPLTTSDIPRSTLSKAVLQNLLAHTISAEAEAVTSEEERRLAIEDDWQYGPEEVGENVFLDESIGRDSIEAAKGLIELFKSEDDEYNPPKVILTPGFCRMITRFLRIKRFSCREIEVQHGVVALLLGRECMA